MFRFVALLVSIVGAAAFAPMARVARSSAIKMSFESEIGAQPPLGFWDPLGLLNDADEARFARLREVETKHGRISMLAILGHLVTTAGVRLPADLTPGYDLSSTPTGLAALSALPAEAIFGTLLVVALIEGGYAARKVRVVSKAPLLIVLFSLISSTSTASTCMKGRDRGGSAPRVRLGPRDHRQEAGHRAEQRPRCADGHPGPDGAREVGQQPLHHQLPPGCPRQVQLSPPCSATWPAADKMSTPLKIIPSLCFLDAL